MHKLLSDRRSKRSSKTVTYGRLRDALVSLGFNTVIAPGYTLFRNEERDAIVVIPKAPPFELVRPVHLIAARETVIGKGVADLESFDRALWLAKPDAIHANAETVVDGRRLAIGHSIGRGAIRALGRKKKAGASYPRRSQKTT